MKEKEKSFAMEILGDYKKANKRLFIMWIITFLALIGGIVYIIYLYNDTVVVSTTQEIEDVETIENSNITNGDMYGENKAN